MNHEMLCELAEASVIGAVVFGWIIVFNEVLLFISKRWK